MATLTAGPTKRIGAMLSAIEKDSQANAGIKALMPRAAELGGKTTALLAGIAMDPMARRLWDEKLDAMWLQDYERLAKLTAVPEVIVGGGLHAAIYSAVRSARGLTPPLIVEESRIGGIFGISGSPAFYLNSRNRPGPLSLPLQGGALNAVPGSPLQPSHISNSEYQRNSDLAFIIRTTVAMSADALIGKSVRSIDWSGNTEMPYVVTFGNQQVMTSRIIIATGLGRPRDTGELYTPNTENRDRVLSYPEFMARFNQPFPLRGLGRVAVVGAGDSGRTVIEALTGQGPSDHMSVAALDWPESIDWYGVGTESTCQSYEENQRSRYRRIARLLPDPPRKGRIVPRAKATQITCGFDCAYVDERPYDHVILCIGFERRARRILEPIGFNEFMPTQAFGRVVGTQRPGAEIYVVGPAAGLDVETLEAQSTRAFQIADENRAAIFRYADRTAALAMALPGTKAKVPPQRKPRKKSGGAAYTKGF